MSSPGSANPSDPNGAPDVDIVMLYCTAALGNATSEPIAGTYQPQMFIATIDPANGATLTVEPIEGVTWILRDDMPGVHGILVYDDTETLIHNFPFPPVVPKTGRSLTYSPKEAPSP